MNINKLFILCYISFSITLAQDTNEYAEIANELTFRIKFSEKIPNLFDDNKFQIVVAKLDSLAGLNKPNHKQRLNINIPEFHWCYAQTYMIVNRSDLASDHYLKFKNIKNIKQLTSPFDQPIQALEKPSQSNQLSLINSIYKNIETLKKDDINIVDDRVKVLQANLNEYNSLTSSNLSLDIDGRIGPITKSAIFDFEKSTEFDSNYDIKSNEIDLEVDQNLTLTSKVNTKMSNTFEKKAPSFSNKIIITSEELATLPSESLAEILESIVGLNVSKRGADDVRASISIFGGTSEHTLILVDGLKISNQQTLQHDLDLPVNISDIHQIEISRNAQGRTFGTGAISGIINIITKEGQDKRTHISYDFGDYKLRTLNLGLTQSIGKSLHNMSYSKASSEGYLVNTDFSKQTIFYKYSLDEGNTSTDFSFGYLLRDNNFINTVENVYPRQSELNLTRFFNSKIKWDFNNAQLETNTHWFNHSDKFLKDNNQQDNYDHYSNTEIGYNVITSKESKRGLNTLAFTFNRESNSNTIVKEIIRDHYLITYQNDFTKNNWIINWGFSANSITDDFANLYSNMEFSPGYQLAYKINNFANFYHNYNKGFRVPSFYELYANDYLYTGNSQLENESINSFEYGMQVFGEQMELNLSLFYKSSTNVIDWYATNSGVEKWKSDNIENVLTSGHNIQLEIFPQLMKKMKKINRLKLGYAYLDIMHTDSETQFRSLSNYLRHQFIFNTDLYLLFGINQSFIARYEQPSNSENRLIMDTKIYFNIWKFETSFSIDNISNIQYEDVKNVSLPGRWMKLKLILNL